MGNERMMLETIAGNHWRKSLGAWTIPRAILNQAPENPWIHPPVMFQLPEVLEDSISHQLAREALAPADSILDIGCGGGIAAFAVTPPAARVIGVDHQPEMLEMFASNARDRDLSWKVHEGVWPAIADQVEPADVVATHHVLYNVPDIEAFINTINSHARKRVVIEIPQSHPTTNANALWKYFWNIERPREPSSDVVMDVLHELGINANCELWQGRLRSELDVQTQAHFMRIRLCLPEERESEVLNFLLSNPAPNMRKLATIWWDI